MESSNVTLEEVWPVYFASERLRSGVRIAQPTLQYKCRTGVNGCDTSKPGFMQWAAPSAVTEAFVGATDDDYLSHFVAKVLTELTYEPSERRDLPFFALREAGADAQGRELVVLNGRVHVFKNIVVEFRNVNGTRPQVEREAERLIAQHMSQFGFRRRLFSNRFAVLVVDSLQLGSYVDWLPERAAPDRLCRAAVRRASLR